MRVDALSARDWDRPRKRYASAHTTRKVAAKTPATSIGRLTPDALDTAKTDAIIASGR